MTFKQERAEANKKGTMMPNETDTLLRKGPTIDPKANASIIYDMFFALSSLLLLSATAAWAISKLPEKNPELKRIKIKNKNHVFQTVIAVRA